MKLLLALPFVFVSSIAIAAPKKSTQTVNSSTVTLGKRLTPDDASKVATGLRVTFVIPAWNTNADRSGGGEDKASSSSSASSAFGLFVGGADIPVQKLGWLGGATLVKATVDKDDYTLLRAEMNMTWGFTKQVYTRWGANLHKITQSPFDLDGNVGLQTAAGLQLNRTLGAELALVYMSQKGSKGGFSYDTRETGLELGITGTF